MVSRCLNQENCRYNGEILKDLSLEILKDFFHLEFICPETEIGMPTPRPPIRIILEKGKADLIQPSTSKSFLEPMKSFTRRRLEHIQTIDGFFMKARSPSCGVYDTPRFKMKLGDEEHDQGAGVFSGLALEKFPHLPFIDEHRIKIKRYRDSFFTACFASAKLRHPSTNLRDFHQEYQLLYKFRDRTLISTLENLLLTGDRTSYQNLSLSILNQPENDVLREEWENECQEKSISKGDHHGLSRLLNPYPEALR